MLDFPNATSSWRVATPEELALALLPEQYDDRDPYLSRSPPGTPNCSFAFKHGCLGTCRGLIPGYHLDDSRSASYIYDDGSRPAPIDAYAGLRKLLFRALEDGGPCSIGFSGDSVIHDVWSATVTGAMRLGFRPTRCVCSAGTLKWHSLETRGGAAHFCPSSASEPGACYVVLDTSNIAADDADATSSNSSSSRPQTNMTCAAITIRYHQIVPNRHLAALPQHHRYIMPAKQVLSLSSIVIHHVGLLHGNTEAEASLLLDQHFQPLIEEVSSRWQHSWVHNDGRARSCARLLWLETMPQHFKTPTGSGLFSDVANRRDPHMRCKPVTDVNASSWRNHLYTRWSRSRREPAQELRAISGTTTVPAWLDVAQFDALLPRYDMHPFSECTHWCYSPFLYMPMWEGVASALARYQSLQRGHRRLKSPPPAASPPEDPVHHMIPVTDSNVLVEGRHVFTPEGGIAFDHPGVKFTASFVGASMVSAVMSQNGRIPNTFVVYVDGQRVGTSPTFAFNTSLWSQNDTTIVPLCAGLDPTTAHTVVVIKASEARLTGCNPSEGKHRAPSRVVAPNYVTLFGFQGTEGMRLVAPPQPPARRIEFIGDSVTAGLCNLCRVAHSPGTKLPVGVEESVMMSNWADESFLEAFPSIVCAQLGATCRTAAWSGFGMVANKCNTPTRMTDIWKRTLASISSDDPAGDPHGTIPTNRHNFSSWTAHAVVINLGTNDAISRAWHGLVPRYTETYTELVRDIVNAYGNQTAFFLVCGPMTYEYCEATSEVARHAKQTLGLRAFAVRLRRLKGANACCGHPSSKEMAVIAPEFVGLIDDAFGWPRLPYHELEQDQQRGAVAPLADDVLMAKHVDPAGPCGRRRATCPFAILA